MKTTTNEFIAAKAMVKRKVETTYEYWPILGEILGIWRKQETNMVGRTIELHIQTPLEEYDRFYINGKEINFK